MATVSDVTVTPTSGLNYIDALLDTGPDWNFLPANNGVPGNNTLYYTFSIASGNEKDKTGQEAFTATQQVATRTAFDVISKITGIKFVETVVGTDAEIHLCNIDIDGANVTGLCSWQSGYSYAGTELKDYDADAWVYLDNVQWRAQNRDLAPGTQGYETLLHELGHALGLKHPFDSDGDNKTVLSGSQDSTANTIMSYTDVGGPYASYQSYDLAALKWLYGGDGLGGALGINSDKGGRYIAGTNGNDTLTGTSADDTLEGDGGNDMINGGDGTDTAVFRSVRSNYTITQLASGDLSVASKDGLDGTETLRSIEILKFTDMSVSRADIASVKVPQLTVTKNAAGYATTGDRAVASGQADPGVTVKLYTADNVLVGTGTADAKTGIWSITSDPFKDGLNYKLYAVATDAAGNTSGHSDIVSFNIDNTAPVLPTVSLSYTQGSNQATFTGTGEPGTLIELMRTSDFSDIATATVGTDGKWSLTTSPLPNGAYEISTVSSDAVNSTSAANRVSFTVSNPNNILGTGGKDVLKPGAGNNAVDGQGGLDTAVYTGARANYTVSKSVLGFDVVDKVGGDGHDSLINVERVQFSDGWLALDVDGTAGQAFRLYQAAFDRPAEAAGLGFWIQNLDSGVTLKQVAAGFLQQPEFIKMYGPNSTDAEFLTLLYNHVMHRAPDQGGYDFWMNAMQVSHVSREDVLVNFSESVENQAQVIGTIQDGMTYIPWKA